MRRIARRGFLQRGSLGVISALVSAGGLVSCADARVAPATATGAAPTQPLLTDTSQAQASSVTPSGSSTPESAPPVENSISLQAALSARRSVRSYRRDMPPAIEDIAQLFWAAQGVTRSWGGRTAPSAGALYPLELYAALEAGVLHYVPSGHRVEVALEHDVRQALWAAGLRQGSLAAAPVVFVLTAVFQRTAAKYGHRAERYVYLEAGHAAQNLLLQAVSQDLGAVVIGAFDDAQVSDALGLLPEESPVYLIPVGHL